MIPGEPLPGSYDGAKAVWSIPSEEGSRPIAETGGRLLEVQTKTKVIQEVDDEIPGSLQMMTKTFVAVERDEDDEMLN